MYLELFDYFINNHDVPQNTALPLSPDFLSASYDDPSSRLVEDKTPLKSKDGSQNATIMGGITMQSIERCLKLATLFVDNSESIFRNLNLNDYKIFHLSLLELKSNLINTMNILLFNSDINKKLPNVEKIHENIKMEDTEESDCNNKIENDSKMDDEHKDDDVEDISFEDKDKHDDSDSMEYKNETECMSWIFNEDISCTHGTFLINSLLQYLFFFFCSLLVRIFATITISLFFVLN